GHTASSNSSPWRIRDSAGSTPDLRRHCGGPGSDTDPGPALPPPGGQDRAACPGPHAQPETMRLGAVAVVRLERALTHRRLHLRFVTGGPAARRASARQTARESLGRVTVCASVTTGQTSGAAATRSIDPTRSRNGRLLNAA